jgi:hypothetical protein
MGFFSDVGKTLKKAAPFMAAPLTGGLSLFAAAPGIFGSMAPQINVPGPTSAEQEIMNIQLQELKSLRAEREAIMPLVMQELGIRRTSEGGFEQIPEAELPEALRMERQIQRQTQERQLMALEGRLPISPALTKNLDLQQQQINEGLSRQGAAPGSTPFIQSQRQFGEQRGLLEEEARRGAITQGAGLLASSASILGNVGPQAAQSLFGTSQTRIPTIGASGGLLQPYQFQRQMDMSGNIINAQTRAQLISDIFGLAGTGVGALLGKG